jgi:hypothetical protein
MIMSNVNRTEIAAAVLLLLNHGFTISRNGVEKGPTSAPRAAAPTPTAPKAAAPAPKAAPVAAAPKATTTDGRSAYTCGVCGESGHNARHHSKAPTAAAPVAKPAPIAPKASAPAPKAAAPAAPKARPAALPATPALADLDFDLDMTGGVESEEAPALDLDTSTEASAPDAAPADTSEASDADLDGFLDEIDALLPG